MIQSARRLEWWQFKGYNSADNCSDDDDVASSRHCDGNGDDSEDGDHEDADTYAASDVYDEVSSDDDAGECNNDVDFDTSARCPSVSGSLRLVFSAGSKVIWFAESDILCGTGSVLLSV